MHSVEPPPAESRGYTHTKRIENAVRKSIPHVVTSMPTKGIKIRLPSRVPRHPPIRSAEYSGDIKFFWSSIPRDEEDPLSGRLA